MKCNGLNVITDFFLHMPRIAYKYFSQMMNVIFNAMNATFIEVPKVIFNLNLKIILQEDVDLLEYIKGLRIGILETLTTIMQTISGVQESDCDYKGLVNNEIVEKIFDFTTNTIFSYNTINVDLVKYFYLKNKNFVYFSMALVVDISQINAEIVKTNLSDNFVNKTSEILKNSPIDEQRRLGIVGGEYLDQLLRSINF